MTPFPESLNAPTPNRKDARFTFHFHVRRAVQSKLADLLVGYGYVSAICLANVDQIGPIST